MGDRTWASIQFGGRIRASQLDQLREAIEAEGPEEPFEPTESQYLFQETNYGNLDELLPVLEKLKLPYVTCWGNGWDYDKGWTYWHPQYGEHSLGGEPTIPVIPISNDFEQDLASLLHARRITKLAGDLPPFKVIEP